MRELDIATARRLWALLTKTPMMTTREIAEELGLSSTSVAKRYLDFLVQSGYVHQEYTKKGRAIHRGLRVLIPFSAPLERIPDVAPARSRIDTEHQVIQFIQAHPDASVRELARSLGVTLSTAYNCRCGLRKRGIIRSTRRTEVIEEQAA